MPRPRDMAPAAAPERLRVLIAEDNEFNADLVRALLSRRGHHATVVARGDEALAMLQRASFDVLLLDLDMPGLDGFQVIERIRTRERERGGHLPTIALTARSREEARQRCLAAGMDDFLAKPIHAGALWAALRRVTGKAMECVVPPPRRRQELVDATALLAACGDDDAILQRVTHALRTQLPAGLAQVQMAWARGDPAAVREAAHKFHGMIAAASSVAATVASEIEDLAASGPLPDVGALLERLAPLTDALVDELGTISIEALRAATIRSRC